MYLCAGSWWSRNWYPEGRSCVGNPRGVAVLVSKGEMQIWGGVMMTELRSLLSLFVGCGPDYAVKSAYGQVINLTAAGSLRQVGRILLF